METYYTMAVPHFTESEKEIEWFKWLVVEHYEAILEQWDDQDNQARIYKLKEQDVSRLQKALDYFGMSSSWVEEDYDYCNEQAQFRTYSENN